MTAGLLQLNFIGPQDKYLTGNPQMTYFKSVFRSYSNFSKETYVLPFESDIKLGTTHTCIIKNYGDLLSNLYLSIDLPELVSSNNQESWAGYVNGVGFSIIKSVSIEIGGQLIDKFDSNWMDINNELYDQRSDTLAGKFNTDVTLQENKFKQKLFIPLHFWFSKNPGNALPLIGLEYHEVKLIVEFRNFNEIIKSDISTYSAVNTQISANVIANYIHLDETEKKFFTSKTHDYLIQQVQILSEEEILPTNNTLKIPLDFSHPIKDIIWVILDNSNHSQNIKTGNNWLTYTSSSSMYSDSFNTGKITINGQDKAIEMDASYYRNIVPYETQTYFSRKYIYNYSFSLYPNQFQPSGSCNYSRIQTSFLELTFNEPNNIGGITEGSVKVYGVNYNIFKVMSGMGGLLFMN